MPFFSRTSAAGNNTGSELKTPEEFQWRKNAYENVCRKVKVFANSSYLRQFGCSEVCLKNCELTSPDIKAICTSLLDDPHISSLDLTGNSIGVKGLFYVLQLLDANPNIEELILSETWIGSGTLKHLSECLMKDNIRLKRLDISGNGFTDKDGKDLSNILKCNKRLEYLNVSKNSFGDESGRQIGEALSINSDLVHFDLSWNHLRGKGADAIAHGIARNDSLEILNVAWNGFGFGGTVCMAQALKQNTTLQELDLSNNRVHQKQFLELLDGILANRTLRVLKVALNPIPAMFTSAFLLGIKKKPACGIRELDLSGIVVDREFETILEDIQSERVFICHYECSLAVDRERELEKLMKTQTYNVDPVKILFFVKSNRRAVDFFREVDMDGASRLSREALTRRFKKENIQITSSAFDRLFDYFGQKDSIDLSSFIDGERRFRRKTIAERRKSSATDSVTDYSQTFITPGGADNSKERRLSLAVIDFMQQKRDSPDSSSKWRSVQGSLNKGLLKTASDGTLNKTKYSDTFENISNGQQRLRSSSLSDVFETKTISEADSLPQINPRRFSLINPNQGLAETRESDNSIKRQNGSRLLSSLPPINRQHSVVLENEEEE